MTNTELIVIGGAAALGYWLVAVMWPHLRSRPEKASPPQLPPMAEGPMWYDVLGVSPRAGREEIEAAYRARASEVAPERAAHLGEEFRALARARLAQIELAYDAALRDLEWLRPR